MKQSHFSAKRPRATRRAGVVLLAAATALFGCDYPSEGPVLTHWASAGSAGIGSSTTAGIGGSTTGGSGCDPRDLVCLDFEDSSPIPTLPIIAPTGQAVYDSATSGAGRQSVHITLAAEESYVIEVTSTAAVTSGPLYVRGLFWVPDTYEPASYFVLMEALEAQAQRKVSFDWRPDGFGVNSNGPTSYAAQPLPRKRWFCVELAIDVAATGGRARLSIDGALAAELGDFDSTLGGGGLSRFRIGANAGTGNGAIQLYVDDFVVRAEPIGCP